MTDFFQTLSQTTTLDITQLYILLGIIACLAALLIIFRRQLGEWHEERHVKRMIRRLGTRKLRNLHLPDGMGGEVSIDYLLLTRDGLLVVGVKRFSGLIFGGPKTDQWTQVINRVSYKFPNPDEYMHRQINAVRTLAPDMAIKGIHLFTHRAEFPKGKPDNVMSTRELRLLPKRPTPRDIPGKLRTAWDELVNSISNR
jgi:hypothetical protein